MSFYTKPYNVPESLFKLLCLEEKDRKLPYIYVTQNLLRYIKENNLNDKDNRRLICPNNELRTVLNIDPTREKITYSELGGFVLTLYGVNKQVTCSASTDE